VMRGSQQRAWMWPGGCDGDGRRGGVRSVPGGGIGGSGGLQRLGATEAGTGQAGCEQGRRGGLVRWGPPGRERGSTWASPGKGEAGRA
jgi:hypothetical protein